MAPDKRFKRDARFRKPKSGEGAEEPDERFARRFTDEAFREGARIDPRGKIREDEPELSSESSDSESEDLEIDDAVWAAQDQDAVRLEDVSKRVAFMGLDWSSINAEDILAVCRSFAKEAENVSKVMIYPSEVGKRMSEQEESHGPQFQESTEDENAEEAIRKYNRERSAYFYGVVFCETVETAEALYKELDGISVPSLCAGQPLDVRFIPDDIEFPYPHTSEASKISRTFDARNEEAQPRGGLSHSKALCTWDEDNPKRKKDLMKKMTKKDIEENDLEVYLASASEAEDVNEEDVAEKRKLLLGDCADSDGDLENGSGSDFFEDNNKSDEEADKTATFHPDMEKIVEEVQHKVIAKEAGEDTKKSSWQTYLEKKKEKKKERRQKARRGANVVNDEGEEEAEPDEADAVEMDLLMHEENDRDFDLKEGRRGKKRRNEVDQSGFKEDMADNRLQKMFKDPDFALDPTHPSFRKSETMDKFLAKTRKKKAKRAGKPEETPVTMDEQTSASDIKIFG